MVSPKLARKAMVGKTSLNMSYPSKYRKKRYMYSVYDASYEIYSGKVTQRFASCFRLVHASMIGTTIVLNNQSTREI